ncbi:Vacuolar protein sorting-associated protein [Trichinella pseudospiralis]
MDVKLCARVETNRYRQNSPNDRPCFSTSTPSVTEPSHTGDQSAHPLKGEHACLPTDGRNHLPTPSAGRNYIRL